MAVEAILRVYKKNCNIVPLVWIHDYHLLLASKYIKDACNSQGLEIKLAFFLHTPFPSWDIFRLCPWDNEILEGMLACGSIGFHIEDYGYNFITCCQRGLGCRVDIQKMLIEYHDQIVSINVLPISIPYERFESLAKNAVSVYNSNNNLKLILGVDRLDYTKGLAYKLKAYKTLLKKYPEHIEKIQFLQIAVPSRTDVKEYKELKDEIDKIIGQINGKFSTTNWSPVRYIYDYVSHDKLAGLYRDASIALVTPLRDGMNLVAKEFVACQLDETGVLVLSPFAGAKSTMHEALFANPYEQTNFADVIHKALKLPEEEKRLRMKQLRCREKARDLNFWLISFLKSVNCLVEDNKISHSMPISEDDFGPYLSTYINETSKIALLLDYDGTLAPIAPHPDLAYIPEETKRILERLSQMPDVNVAIISGRSRENVKKMVGIEGITYAGNHGIDITLSNGIEFSYPIPEDYKVKLEILKKRLEEDVCNYGAWVENKGTVITWHYHEVYEGMQKVLIEKAEKIFKETGLNISHSYMAFEARPPIQWDKGYAALFIMDSLYGKNWSDNICTIFAGDDKTDEDAFKALKGKSVTFRVIRSTAVETEANYCLPSCDGVLTLLQWVERRVSSRIPRIMRSGNRDLKNIMFMKRKSVFGNLQTRAV